MKVKIFLALFSMLVAANALFAKIGETEAQTDDRYGKPAGRWDDYLGYKKLYRWHGFEVMVTFLDGVSQREMFVKIEGATDAKVQKYLAKISGSGQNDIIFDDKSGVFTTKAFEEKYIAARTAAWAKTDEKK
jgi:hypothetical protein